MTVTPFGKKMRQIRSERGLLLGDQADAMRISPAYVSSIEHGRKPLTAKFVQELCVALGLSKNLENELLEFAVSEGKRFHFFSRDPMDVQILEAMERHLSKLSGSEKEKILEVIRRQCNVDA